MSKLFLFLSVLFAHFLTGFLFLFSFHSSKTKKNPSKIIVQTMVLKESPLLKEKESSPVKEKHSPLPIKQKEEKKIETQNLKQEKPKIETQKPIIKKSPTKTLAPSPQVKIEAKKNVDLKNSEKIKALEKVKKQLNKMESVPKETNLKKTASLPSLPLIPEETYFSTEDFSEKNFQEEYRQELARHVRLLMKLPEFGEVKLRLTLKSNGEPKKIEILSSESLINAKYVEEKLITLRFPPFGETWGKEHDFILSLGTL